ncbi:hypothetical protein GCM10010277_67680 [Streptomyces longisporoflavus]|nr:hypothetical protein GCM10010277_67680 [Streptomyces longisporoflavus]
MAGLSIAALGTGTLGSSGSDIGMRLPACSKGRLAVAAVALRLWLCDCVGCDSAVRLYSRTALLLLVIACY